MVTKTMSPRVGVYLPFIVVSSFVFIGQELLPRDMTPGFRASCLRVCVGVYVMGFVMQFMQRLVLRGRRSKQIEHLTRLTQTGHDPFVADLPIRIGYRSGLCKMQYAAVPVRVLAWCMIPGTVLCAISFAFAAPLSGLHGIPPLIGLALLCLGCQIAINLDTNSICEITSRGMSAPTGLLALRTTFVPWEEVTECEVIHDNENAIQPYFLLRDRAGSLQFKSSYTWLYAVKPADRERIHEVLKSRFPRHQSGKSHGRSVPESVSSSEVWDRQLDG